MGQLHVSSIASRPAADAADALRAGLPPGSLTRFAPAPTGYLHLGHVVNAIYVWGLATAAGGRVILRIEDHDSQRSTKEWESHLLDDLDWLGFAADVYPTGDYRAPHCDGRQSERHSIYREAIAPLIERGLVYGCRCSRADLAAAAGQEPAPRHQERRYPGTCRGLGIAPADGVAWRLNVDPGVEVFDDAFAGRTEQDPSAQCGDLLLRDRLGNWTYQCVASIDDAVQGVTLVVRGIDLLPSTGRQMLLARLAGRAAPPVFAHHPLIMKSPTQKLSKSDGDSGVRELRRAGWPAPAVIGHAAALVGLNPSGRPVDAREVGALFART